MGRPEQASISARIAQLQRMSVGELRLEYGMVFKELPRSNNKVWLWRRISWRIQELKFGGLSQRAKKRLEELMPDAEIALRVPRGYFDNLQESGPRRIRDKRIPPVGTVLLRKYKGQAVTVNVREVGFEWDGRHFRSLSSIAREITGQRWNGFLFFGLTKRKGKV